MRVFEPDEILPALEQAKKLMAEFRVPVIVEAILERVTNVSMGTELDNVTEFEELAADGSRRAHRGVCEPRLMTRVLLAPDKFKGTLTGAEVAASLAEGIRSRRPTADVVAVPVADGGDGSLAAFEAAGFERIAVRATDATGRTAPTCYVRRGEDAVVELAEVAGLARTADAPRSRRSPRRAGASAR